MMHLFSDEMIARRCQSQAHHFTPLYKRYCKPVYGFIRLRVNTNEDAEDITSRIFMKAFEHIASYNPTFPFRTWLFTIARNTLIDFWRTQKDWVELTETAAMVPLGAIDDHIDAQLLTAELLQQLTAAERYLLLLRFQDGLSYKQMAELTGKTDNTLMVAFHRIKTKLHQPAYDQA